ncbi:hypothetical protein FQR65_LT06149 [Abscondita terminalis]|nr:hypothetical protein FQR65_LT06149 [Abscondita terminalis]
MLKTLYASTTAPYMGFFMFDQPHLLIRDFDLIKNILITDFDYFSDRRAVTSQRDAIDKYLEKDIVDGRSLGLNFGVDVISSCVFGFEANALKGCNSIFVKSALKLFEVTINRGIQIVLCFFSPKLVNLLNFTFLDITATSTLSSIFLRVCKDRKTTGTKRGDFVDILNTMTMNGDALDDEHLAGLAIQMLLAGHETSGTTAGFLLYELCYNVDVQSRLREEVKNVLKDNDNKISYETINQMTYLDMVVNEILRKYPVLGFLDRICLTNYRVPGTNYTIEKGIPVIIPVYALHQDDRYYSEPEKFDPERFSPDNKNSIPTCAYMPFGEGLRFCIESYGARSVTFNIAPISMHLHFVINRITFFANREIVDYDFGRTNWQRVTNVFRFHTYFGLFLTLSAVVGFEQFTSNYFDPLYFISKVFISTLLYLDHIFVLLFVVRVGQSLIDTRYDLVVSNDAESLRQVSLAFNDLNHDLLRHSVLLKNVFTCFVFMILGRMWSSIYISVYIWTTQILPLQLMYITASVAIDLYHLIFILYCCEDVYKQERCLQLAVDEIMYVASSNRYEENELLSIHMLIATIQFSGYGFKLNTQLLSKVTKIYSHKLEVLLTSGDPLNVT